MQNVVSKVTSRTMLENIKARTESIRAVNVQQNIQAKERIYEEACMRVTQTIDSVYLKIEEWQNTRKNSHLSVIEGFKFIVYSPTYNSGRIFATTDFRTEESICGDIKISETVDLNLLCEKFEECGWEIWEYSVKSEQSGNFEVIEEKPGIVLYFSVE